MLVYRERRVRRKKGKGGFRLLSASLSYSSRKQVKKGRHAAPVLVMISLMSEKHHDQETVWEASVGPTLP